LFADHEKFVNEVYGRREAEVIEMHAVKPEEAANAFKPYENDVKELREKFGYPKKEGEGIDKMTSANPNKIE